MRTVLVYLLALSAVAAAVLFGFPEWFALSAGADAAAGPRRSASAAVPVVVAEVVQRPFIDSLEALGTVLANESVAITPNASDHIVKLHFDDGEQVEKGQLLAEIAAAEERARLAEATAVRNEAKVRNEQTIELFGKDMKSQRDLDNIRALLAAAEARVVALEAAIVDREVRAPFKGTLGLRRVSEGAYVDPRTLITTLDDLTVVKLDFTIPETWLTTVRPGMSIRARSDAFRDLEFHGEVRTLDTRLDQRTRSATVRAHLPNDDGVLRPGMLLKVTVERGEQPVLQVPEAAVVLVGDEHFVWRVADDDVVQRATIDVGRRRVGAVEVRAGLEAGQRVVVEGLVRVRPGAVVKVVDTRQLQ